MAPEKDAGSVVVRIGLSLTKFLSEMQKVEKRIQKFGKDLESTGKSISKTLTIPLTGFATGAVLAFSKVDDALDKIRIGTGATGTALKGLEGDFRKVFQNSFESADKVATAIADLNVRLGLSGEPLQKLSTQVLQLARMTGGDLAQSVDVSTRIFARFNVEAEKQSETLDFIFKAAQSTGVSYSNLSESILSAATPLREVGLGLEESTVLLAQLAKKGINAEGVTKGFSIAIRNLAKAGIEPSQALGLLIDKIKSAGTETKAQAIAFKIFGKGGLEVAAAIRSGAVDIEGALKKVKQSTETIGDAFDDTKGFQETFQKLRNNIETALEPVGEELGSVFERVAPRLIDSVQKIGEAFANLSPATKDMTVELGAIAVASGPVVIALATVTKSIGSMLGFVIGIPSTLKSVTLAIVGVFQKLAIFAAANPLTAIAVALAAAGVAAYVYSEDIRKAFDAVVQFIRTAVDTVVERIGVLYDRFMDGARKFQAGVRVLNESNPFYGSFYKQAYAEADRLAAEQTKNQAEQAKISERWQQALVGGYESISSAAQNAFTGTVLPGLEKAKEGFGKLKLAAEEPPKELKKTGDAADGASDKLDKLLAGGKEKAKAAAEAVKDLRQKLVDLGNDNAQKKLFESLDKALSSNNVSRAADIKQQIYDSVFKGTLDGYTDAVKKGGPEAEKVAREIARQTAEEQVREIDTRIEETSDKIKAELSKAHEESVDSWVNAFQNAINGQAFNVTDIGKRLGVGMAASFMASLSGSLGNATASLENIGSKIADGILQKFGTSNSGSSSNLLDSIGNIFGIGSNQIAPGTSGIGPVADGSAYGSALESSSLASSLVSAGGMFAAAQGLQGLLRQLQSNRQNVGGGALNGAMAGAGIGTMIAPGVGTAIGAGVGGIAGAISGMFGSGSMDADSAARKKIENWLETALKGKLSSIFDSNGRSTPFSGNVDFSSVDFSKNWSKQFQDMGDEAVSVFGGLGAAITKLQGVTEDVGAQIGFVLAKNLLGNVDNARLLVKALGLDFYQVQDALVESANRGEISWHEFEVQMQGVADAFKPGLKALGDMDGALQQVIDSGGKGQQAVQGLRNLSVEAIEAGVTSLTDLRSRLVTSGKYTTEQINAIFSAFQSRGVTNLQQLGEVSDRIGGGIIADMESAGFKFNEAADAISNVIDKINQIPQVTERDIKFNVTTEVDSNTEKYVGDLIPSGGSIAKSLGGKSINPYDLAGVLAPTTTTRVSGSGRSKSRKSSSRSSRTNPAVEARKQLTESLSNLRANVRREDLADRFDSAIASGDLTSAKKIRDQIYRSTYDGTLHGQADAIKKGGAQAKRTAIELAKLTAQEEAKRYDEIIADTRNNPAKELAKRMEEARKAFSDAVKAATGKDFGFMADAGKFFDSMTSSSKNLFNALSTGLMKTMNLSDDLAESLNKALAMNLNGNLDQARYLLGSLNADYQSFEDAIVESGRTEKKSWAEVEAEISSLKEAFAPGIQGVANYEKAFTNFLSSDGKGFDAVQSVRDLGIELMEAGATTLDQAKFLLSSLGTLPAGVIEALFASASSRGVTNLSDLAQLSDRIAGGIVSDVTNSGAAFKPKPFARGGIISAPSLFTSGVNIGTIGEAGPEVILPLTKVGGKMGVKASGNGGGFVIQIDARGAAPGVENAIESAIRRMKDLAVREAVATVAQMKQRGGSFGGVF